MSKWLILHSLESLLFLKLTHSSLVFHLENVNVNMCSHSLHICVDGVT